MIEAAVAGRESPVRRVRHLVPAKLGILADQKECEGPNYNPAVTSAFEALRENQPAAGRIEAASVPNASIGTVYGDRRSNGYGP